MGGPATRRWITNLAAAGQLSGLAGLRQGRGLDIRPFVSGGEENSDGKFKAGPRRLQEPHLEPDGVA